VLAAAAGNAAAGTAAGDAAAGNAAAGTAAGDAAAGNVAAGTAGCALLQGTRQLDLQGLVLHLLPLHPYPCQLLLLRLLLLLRCPCCPRCPCSPGRTSILAL
jgi:hypothetical protein